MQRKIRITLIPVLLFTLVAGLPLLAQGGPGYGRGDGQGYGHGHGPHGQGRGDGFGPLMGVCRQLDLTDAQRDQVHATVTQAMDEGLGDLVRAHREARQQARRVVHDPTSDEATIADALRAEAQAHEQVALAEHRLSVSVFDILTEEQRAKALELLGSMPDDPMPPMRRHGRYGPPSDE